MRLDNVSANNFLIKVQEVHNEALAMAQRIQKISGISSRVMNERLNPSTVSSQTVADRDTQAFFEGQKIGESLQSIISTQSLESQGDCGIRVH